MRRQKGLFQTMRVCVCCGTERQNSRGKQIFAGASILAITPLMYRRADTGFGRQLDSARRVQVCEACFQKVITSDLTRPSETVVKFWNALRESMTKRYAGWLELETKTDRAEANERGRAE